MAERGERLNIVSDPDSLPAEETASPAAPSRPFVAIHFVCCRVYTRIYLNRNGSAYHGACPKCCRPATIRVSDDGTDARFFEVG